ncbi:hypothetical protein O6H91_07G128000 [Diphasiastrum complanatum]|uniref:Uncharacterized protein n=3 Tax=Diphasiastrum complanatum TaxID=34168 RepID=A0ACC2D9J6_DIPCM|nr:hypothetical protein O6H91_07G128000 [Diphasiastrum complanatum]KAJ7550983.1 hypothetical protein O6H91_07G128000 [Diphasiastrum complanatum]
MTSSLVFICAASGFGSKNKYLFGHISMNIKLVPQDSAGTVTAFYLSSETSKHDELDFEFLGNFSGDPYILQTNVYANGVGDKEQRFYLWFDPTTDFHNYSLLWNRQQVIFKVDGVPIRVFKNKEALGLAYPSSQAMKIYSTLWNGDSWATRGGLTKINWAHSPFIATYQNFGIDACQWTDSTSNCPASNSWWSQVSFDTLGSKAKSQLKWVQQNYMIYNYCTDTKRFSTTPAECTSGN